MGFFEQPDPRLIESADPSPAAAVGRALKRQALALALASAALLGVYAGNVIVGLHDTATTRGTIVARGLYAPVTIVRDRRDVPHIRAAGDHDLFFAQGYVEASDRLFQLDLSRRYAYGTLAEVLGAKALPYDKVQRAVDIDAIARRQLRALAPADRAELTAYSDGINAAAAAQPLPVEFRMLLYRPAPWTPKDSLAVSIVASLELADSWHDVFARDAVWRQHGARCFDRFYPLSDARYDVSVRAQVARRAPVPSPACEDSNIAAYVTHPPIGSNAWAAGARRSNDGAPLLANDPHIDLTVPGIWYLIDLQSPQLHAAGAAIPGIPGVALGHNEHIAWASTNAATATTSVFDAGRLMRSGWKVERFHVRFGRDVHVAYYRTAREFSVPDESDPSRVALVRWPIYAQSRSTIVTELALDRARNGREARGVLARYPGSPQGFIVADRGGEVAYQVAGIVPNDPAWGRYVHPARDLRKTYVPIPFARLPAVAASRDAVVLAANNKPYGAGYPYRLSPQFQPPYRAFRIAQLLRDRKRYDASYFAEMQLDTLSTIDLEVARDVFQMTRARSHGWNGEAIDALGRWDGRYAPQSRTAALAHALREALLQDGPAFNLRLQALRGASHAGFDFEREIDAALSLVAFRETAPWRNAGGTRVEHLLAPMHFGFLNGDWLPGAGDEYTVHLQEPGFAQGFRAVWDLRDWDRGGIAIPSGESGEPGSGHYTDLTRAWVSGRLDALPFSPAAIRAQTRETLVLRPQPS
ncbi:MAG TPA: penicillin acylase family protein [Candidatus Cybelea sp.]|nr:penicillin acylase family protein [Candidatus Cybelea sp.]